MTLRALPLLAAASLLAACGGADDGSPTAAENEQLNRIAAEADAAAATDTSPDSLVADPALGNGESAETGDVLVADQNGAGANLQ